MRAQAPTAPTALSASSTPMCTAPALRPHHHHLLCYCPHLAALGSVSAIVPPGCPSVRPPPLPSALCPPILRRHHPPSPHLAALGSVSAIVPWLGFSVILEASKASNVSPPPPLPSPPPPPPPPSALCPPPPPQPLYVVTTITHCPPLTAFTPLPLSTWPPLRHRPHLTAPNPLRPHRPQRFAHPLYVVTTLPHCPHRSSPLFGSLPLSRPGCPWFGFSDIKRLPFVHPHAPNTLPIDPLYVPPPRSPPSLLCHCPHLAALGSVSAIAPTWLPLVRVFKSFWNIF